MGEHVGEQHYPLYAAIMLDALQAGGTSAAAADVARTRLAPGGGAFIERYIAPDMHMRPLWQTMRHLQTAGFEVRGVEAMREHYVRTAEHWLDTFEDHYAEFVALRRRGDRPGCGGSTSSAAGWRSNEGRMGVDQVLAARRA